MQAIIMFIFILFSTLFVVLPAKAKQNQMAETTYARNILLVVAMRIEAAPIIKKLNLKKEAHIFSDLPLEVYTGTYANKNIYLVLNGKDPMYKVDSVGTQPAVLATYLGITRFHPDLVISIGTAGGTAEGGAKPNDIYISEKINFFDRRIGDVHAQYGLGGYISPKFDQLISSMAIKKGIICSGNSFNLSPTDKKMILQNHCVAEEMEAASVAWVSMLMKTPMIAIKGIGNIAGGKNNHRDYINNGPSICNKLAETLKLFLHTLPTEPLLTKQAFTFRKVIDNLDLNKSILDQKEVKLGYLDKGVSVSVSAKHDIITLFKINDDYFVLGSPIKNPVSDHPIELKISIGGSKKANYSQSLRMSLANEMAAETQHKLSLSDFTLSPYHVCSRQPNWGDWSVTFIEVVALSNNISDLEALKKKVVSMNTNMHTPYGIYKLDDVVLAAKKTAGLPEGSGKQTSLLKNYLNDKYEGTVIFNDNDLAELFSSLKPKQLFGQANS